MPVLERDCGRHVVGARWLEKVRVVGRVCPLYEGGCGVKSGVVVVSWAAVVGRGSSGAQLSIASLVEDQVVLGLRSGGASQ
jgi:hypothetical protein